jgi:hypothetical protein
MEVDGEPAYRCSASLLSPTVALTAAAIEQRVERRHVLRRVGRSELRRL